ncbi:MAG: porin family protein [Balneolaceae bacterium]
MKSLLKKSIYLFITLFCFSVTNIQAQLLPKFGVKGGANLSTITNTNDTEFKPGIVAGAFVQLNIPLSPIVIQPEVLFTQYGSKAANFDVETQLDYIQIPVLLKFRFSPPLSLAKPSFYAGPYVGFNIRAETNEGLNLEDNIKDSDFGAVAGIGLEIMKLNLDLRYTAGLTNVLEDNFEDGEKNMAVSFTIGIAF